MRIACGPPPDWVEHVPYEQQPATDGCVDNGIHRLLHDSQVRLEPDGFARHYRFVQRVLTRAGAEGVANFAMEFDPAFERLDVHFVRIVRGHETVEHARPEAFQILRREKQLERRALNGRLTASLLIPDVRIDDVLEVAVTLSGGNPVFHGKYAGLVTFNSLAPWMETRHRLVRPTDRPVSSRLFNGPPAVRVESSDSIEQSRWSLVGQTRREAEPYTPSWLILVPTLQFTEFESWSEVARLFESHYADGELPPDLAASIDRLGTDHAEPAARAAEWLRFVQRELRYFALSLGEGGWIPRSLDAIWGSRFGDCKDATRLYVAGARRLGLDACAALVSTTHSFGLGELLPAPNLFNHCIVRLRSGGRTYWLDPTMQRQAGTLDNIFQPHAGWALPLTPDVTEVERMSSEQSSQHFACDDVLEVGPRVESRATLRRRVDYILGTADRVRHQIENGGTARYSEQMLKQLSAGWPNIVETTPVSIRDDPVGNRLSADFTYEIRDCWQPQARKGLLGLRIADDIVARELGPLAGPQRRNEIFLGRPRKVSWSMHVQMPRNWIGKGWKQVFQERSLSFNSSVQLSEDRIDITRELVIDGWSIPADQAAAYSRVASKVRENLSLISGRSFMGRVGPAGLLLARLLQVALVLLLLLLCFGILVGPGLFLTQCTSP